MNRIQSLPHVGLYIRVTDKRGRRYEKIDRKNPQMCGPRDCYCLHFYEAGKRRWESVGTDLNAAIKARFTKEEYLLHRQQTESTNTKPSPGAPRSLGVLREEFITDKKTTFKRDGTPLDPDTIRHYEIVTEEFLKTIQREFPGQVTRQDLKNWMLMLRTGTPTRRAVSHRTVCNLYISIVCFLHFCGIDHKKLIPQSERPAPVDETPEAFSEDELQRFFFAIVNERDSLAYEFLLKTGAREQEMSRLEWTELNLGSNSTVTFGNQHFRTKTGKSRTIPLEKGLAQKLINWRAKNPGTRYVFPTEDGKAEGHFLRIGKSIAQRAGINPADFWLHKFRDTAATWWLRRGVDLRTVSFWLGHASIEMTQKYLAPQQGKHAQGLMNEAFGELEIIPRTQATAC